ncbi:Zn-dependent exopeptidase [Xylariaceae sp. FL0016]|nr:Zn-dependent exopeptidase [Xylariaceae sp. FL0016]
MKLNYLAILLSSSLCASSFEIQKPLQSELESDAPAYRDDLVSLHQSLVEISSISYDEHDVGDFLIEYLTARNFVAERQFLPNDTSTSSSPDTAGKPRFNVVAWPAGQAKPHAPSPKLLVSSHIDTVPPFIPYARTDATPNAETVISGRGSVDAKASVAAQVVAVTQLLDAGRVDPADVMLLFVVGEERTGDGMRRFSDARVARGLAPDLQAAVFGEPTEGKLACGHKGFFGCDVTARGRAGHSGYPWLGKSATELLMRALVKALDADLGSSEEFGNTTINVGTLEGGVAANVIPERASAQIAGRVAIGPELEGGKIVADRLRDVLTSVDEEAFEIECRNGYGVVKCECDVDGFDTITVNYGTDVPNLKGNMTRYLYGPGTIFVAHGPDEALKLKDLETAVEDYKKLIEHALKSK